MNAPVLPRRALLAAFATLPVSIPAAAMSAVSPDAALIAQAEEALALNARFDELDDRASTLDDDLMVHGPRRPAAPAVPVQPTPVVEHRSDGSFSLHMPAPSRSPAEAEAVERVHAAALAAHQVEREAYAERIGLRAAERARNQADRRLKASVEALTAMRASTLQGVIAKARVSAAADPDDSYVTFDGLRTSILSDLLAMSGAA